MKNYFKLVNFELSRFIKIYIVLVGVTIISQIAGAVILSNNYMNEYNNAVYLRGESVSQFMEYSGMMGLSRLLGSEWYVLPVMFSAATLLIYCLFIWYRDWFGKNTFIYRLLMLPTARMNIFFSKATAIFLMVLGLVALQIILFLAAINIIKWIVPANLRMDQSIMEAMYGTYSNMYLGLIIPPTFIEFLINYAVGFTAVFVLFTAILFERSYRLKGLGIGIIYSILVVLLLFLPEFIIIWTQKNYLYPIEFFIVKVVLWAIITASAIMISKHLINKKVTV
ncbi:hypothetical protein [Oceanobacillus sp. CAU 1775]